MPLKKFKPVTPGSRFRSVTSGEVLTRKGPERSLTESLSGSGGETTMVGSQPDAVAVATNAGIAWLISSETRWESLDGWLRSNTIRIGLPISP